MLEVIATALVLLPTGFTENAALNARASYAAGKPVTIGCAQTDQAWANELASLGDAATDVNGVTPVVGGSVAYLSPETCRPILKRLSRLTPSWLALGATLDVLNHESLHMHGVADEGQTECLAIRTLPAYLVHSWGMKRNGKVFLQVMRGAWNYHHALPSQYQAVC